MISWRNGARLLNCRGARNEMYSPLRLQANAKYIYELCILTFQLHKKGKLGEKYAYIAT